MLLYGLICILFYAFFICFVYVKSLSANELVPTWASGKGSRVKSAILFFRNVANFKAKGGTALVKYQYSKL